VRVGISGMRVACHGVRVFIGMESAELIVVRHGQAEHMVKGLTGGWTDTPLTELGRRQAELTGPALAALIGDRPFAFYASDLARAAETAGILARSLGVKPALVPALRELNNGEAAGLTEQQAARIANPITEPLLDWAPYPGAESWRQMSERVVEFLAGPRHELTVLVLHGGSANAAITWWLGLGIGEKMISFELDPCGISRFAVNKWGERTVVKLNDTGHLAVLLQ
jgi:broad specificity phosphatase PhoE